METLHTQRLDKIFKSLTIIALLITALILAKDIILPISFAALFSVVLLPIAKQIENIKGFEEEILNKDLFHFLENELLQKSLPEQIAPLDQYEKFFALGFNVLILQARFAIAYFQHD